MALRRSLRGLETGVRQTSIAGHFIDAAAIPGIRRQRKLQLCEPRQQRPRTECACQPGAFTIASIVAPAGFINNSSTPDDKRDWQLLPDHAFAVARLAAAFAKFLGLEKAAFVAGLFHDLGKYALDFQRRLEGLDIRVDHSTAGAAL